MFDIKEQLKKLPGEPGVYLMKDENDKIIYVGKAISLKNRVKRFFLNWLHFNKIIFSQISQCLLGHFFNF